MTIDFNPNTKQGKRAIAAVNGLLLILIVWFGIANLLHIKPPAVHVAPMAHRSMPSTNAVDLLPQRHLFGQVQADMAVPTTDLNLILAGVFANSDAQDARAAISVNGEDTKLFGIGQTILPGVTLTKVFNTKIYLNNQGRTEQLDMKLEYPSLQH
ncbi:MAG: hypothetical protein CMF39_03820 [Legionellaceae bacterium]|nr:hypothetical protein [Legionellaceae bacterium]